MISLPTVSLAFQILRVLHLLSVTVCSLWRELLVETICRLRKQKKLEVPFCDEYNVVRVDVIKEVSRERVRVKEDLWNWEKRVRSILRQPHLKIGGSNLVPYVLSAYVAGWISVHGRRRNG